MSIKTKTLVIMAGYALAIAAGTIAGIAYDKSVAHLGADAQGGMAAFGNWVAVLAAFGVAALVPTGLAFWWIRKSETLWHWLSRFGLWLAISGPVFVLFFLLLLHPGKHYPMLGEIAMLGMTRLIMAPFIAVALVAGAIFACGAQAKRRLWIAAAIEGGMCVVGAVPFLLHF